MKEPTVDFIDREPLPKNLPKLKLQDIKVGMQVYSEQLSDITDITILLSYETEKDRIATIKFIGDNNSKEMYELLKTTKILEVVFNKKEETMDGVFYE